MLESSPPGPGEGGPWAPLRRLTAIVASGLALLVSLAAIAQHADAAEPGSVGRANLNGGRLDKGFIPGASGNRLAGHRVGEVAVTGRHIYWTHSHRPDNGPFVLEIGRADLDGSNVDPSFIEVPGIAAGLAVDNRHLYWTTSGGGTFAPIGRANLDGTGVDTDFLPGAGALDVAVGPQYIYWTHADMNGIGRANLDGTGVIHDFVADTGQLAGGLAVDAFHLYWTGSFCDGAACGAMIGRANPFDGQGVDRRFITSPNADVVPVWADLAVDGDNIYWGGYGYFYSGLIGRADVNGTAVNPNFLTGIGQRPRGLAIDDRHIYWTAYDDRVGGRATAPDPQAQSGGRIVIRVEIKTKERLTARVTGGIDAGSAYELGPVTADLAAGERTVLRLRPERAAQGESIYAALTRGKEVNAQLAVRLTDRPGNIKTKKLRVELKRR